MRQEALKMILAMLAVGLVVFAVSGHPLALIIVGSAAWSVWWVARKFE